MVRRLFQQDLGKGETLRPTFFCSPRGLCLQISVSHTVVSMISASRHHRKSIETIVLEAEKSGGRTWYVKCSRVHQVVVNSQA